MPAFIIQSPEAPPVADPAGGIFGSQGEVRELGRVIGPFETVEQAESWCEATLHTGRLADTREFIVEAREVEYEIEAKVSP